VRLVVEALVIRKSVDDPVDVKKFVEVALPRTELVEKRFVVVSPVDEALARVVCPVTKRLPEADTFVAEALASVLCPVAESVEVKRLVAVTPVVEALVMLASVEKSVATVPTVVEEVLRTV
jgi:hypothetical protein